MAAANVLITPLFTFNYYENTPERNRRRQPAVCRRGSVGHAPDSEPTTDTFAEKPLSICYIYPTLHTSLPTAPKPSRDAHQLAVAKLLLLPASLRLPAPTPDA